MAHTFALGSHGRVELWVRGIPHKGFTVINGGWAGYIKDGELHFRHRDNMETEHRKINVLWEGHVPSPQSYDYNTAIAWIQEQVDAGIACTYEDMSGWTAKFAALVNSLDTPEKQRKFLLGFEEYQAEFYADESEELPEDDDDQIPF